MFPGDPYNSFYCFFIDENGINPPQITTVSGTASDSRGYLKVSPDGSKIAIAHMANGLYLYDFDSTSTFPMVLLK